MIIGYRLRHLSPIRYSQLDKDHCIDQFSFIHDSAYKELQNCF